MIATQRRMAIHDFLLVAISVVVIVLSWSPKDEPRQIVEIRGSGDQSQRYSLKLDDPRLAFLRRELANPSDQTASKSLAKAKWRAEVAEFYASRTAVEASQPQEVVHVSFTDKQPAATDSHALQTQHEYWLRFRDRSQSQIAATEKLLEQQRARSGSPRIVIGPLTRATFPPSVFALAAAIGLGMAMLVACWIYLSPAICFAPEPTAPGTGVDRSNVAFASPEVNRKSALQSHSREFQLVIPAHWIRLRQPASVLLRRAVVTAIVGTALVCLVA